MNLEQSVFEIPETLAAWKRRRTKLRTKLWDLLLGGDVPPAPAPQCRILLEGDAVAAKCRENWDYYFKYRPEDFKGFTHLQFAWKGEVTWDTYLISYPGWAGEPDQQAILRVPKDRSKPMPAVICTHGHAPGCAFGKEEMNYMAVPLAARGIVTLAPDVLRFGDRRDRTYEEADLKDFNGMAFYSERTLAMPLLLEGKTLLGASIWEQMRAVDMLASLPYVDAKRIGCTGMSMGGIHTFWLSAMDERIAAGAEVCGVSSFRIWAKQRTLNALFCFIPHILRCTDAGEIGGLIAPRPFLALDATSDGFFPLEGVEETDRGMQAVYDLYGAKDRLTLVRHTGGHEFVDADIRMTMDWLVANL